MSWFWAWIIGLLTWLSAQPRQVEREHPKAAAAVALARASMLVDTAPPSPAPTPVACDCGQTCVKGFWKPDGRISQACKCSCKRCQAERAKTAAACPDGTCPTARIVR